MMNILVAGDLYPQNRIEKLMKEVRYGEILGDTPSLIKSADFSIVNLETPIITDNRVKPIQKSGACLKTTSDVIALLKYAGFGVVTLANNHLLDYGAEGLNSTLRELSKEDINYVGAGENLAQASSILYLEKENEKVAIINCCEHEFSIAGKNKPGCNPLNSIEQYYAIQEAKSKAKHVLLIIHGGNEHYQLPSPRMQQIYRFFVDAGADAVINHHQHCYCGYEIYKSKPILYGLGNFSFDSITDNKYRASTWNYGYMVSVTLGETVTFKLHPYSQNKEELVGTHLLKVDEQKEFDNRIKELNTIINDNRLLKNHHLEFLQKWEDSMKMLFTPYRGRLLQAAYRRGLLPSFVSDNYKIQLQNRIECESHYEKVLYMLKNRNHE